MTRVTIQGIGALGAFGCGVAALRSALVAGRSPGSVLTVPTGSGPVELAAFRADPSPLKDRVSARVLRRMDHFTRMGLLGALLALEDAGLEPSGHAGLGLVIASGYGATATTYALLDSIIQDGDPCTSPIHFANSLHNACAANIALALGSTGPNLTVSQFNLSVPSALLTARQWLLEGRVERVLFGALDELSDLSGYLWLRQRGLPGPGPMAPLETGRETAVPGEGALFMLLSRLEEARPAYCTLGQVVLGRSPGGGRQPGWSPSSPKPLILGADGRRELGPRYAAAGQGATVACFTPLYGSMPAAPAFDLAAGALVLKDGLMFPSPGASARDFPGETAPGGALGSDGLSCLVLAEDHGFGMVEIGTTGDTISR